MNEQSNTEIKQTWLQKNESKIMLGLIGFAVLALVIVIGFYTVKFHQNIWVVKPEELGTFGDFIGGILNPIFAFLAFLILAMSFRLQSKELKETREELAKASEAQVEQTKLAVKQLEQIDRQNFENFLSQLMEHKTRLWKGYLEEYPDKLSIRRMSLWSIAYRGFHTFEHSNKFKTPFDTIDFIKQLDGYIAVFIQIHEHFRKSHDNDKGVYEKMLIGFLSVEEIHVIVFYYLLSRQIQKFDATGEKYGSYTNLLNIDAIEQLKPIIEHYELMRLCDKSYFNETGTKQALRAFLDKKAWGDKWEFWRVNFFNEDEKSDDKTE